MVTPFPPLMGAAGAAAVTTPALVPAKPLGHIPCWRQSHQVLDTDECPRGNATSSAGTWRPCHPVLLSPNSLFSMLFPFQPEVGFF